VRTVIACGALAVLLMAGTACGPSDTTLPTPPNTPVVNPAPPPAPPSESRPLPAGPARTFVFDHEVSYHVSDYTRESSFILYDSHAFALRFEGLSLEYRGTYSESKGVIVFDWEGWSGAGPWGATGTLKGDTLIVNYNTIMSLTDFEDAAYVIQR